MKISKDIPCILNWIQIPKLNSNSIEEEWDANWYKRYWKRASDYVIQKQKLQKNTNLKRHLSNPLYLTIG
jgi:hypothetical protein